MEKDKKEELRQLRRSVNALSELTTELGIAFSDYAADVVEGDDADKSELLAMVAALKEKAEALFVNFSK